VSVDLAIVIAGIAVEAVAISSYIRTLVRGGSNPLWVAWLVWTLIGVIGTWAAFDGGAGAIGVVVPLSFVLVTFAIFALSCTKSKAIVTRWDLALGAISVVTLVAWQTLDLSPGYAATAAIFADSCVMYPMLRNTWRNPASEPLYPWVGTSFTATCGLLVLHHHTYAATAYPAYILAANLAIVAVIAFARPDGEISSPAAPA
jgi:hypothetical protein